MIIKINVNKKNFLVDLSKIIIFDIFPHMFSLQFSNGIILFTLILIYKYIVRCSSFFLVSNPLTNKIKKIVRVGYRGLNLNLNFNCSMFRQIYLLSLKKKYIFCIFKKNKAIRDII